MSLATRCTACGTVFRVVQDQLKVSEGWVRCGRCKEVFNALEGLFDLDREAPPPWQPPAPPPVAESGVDVSLPVDEAKAEAAPAAADDAGCPTSTVVDGTPQPLPLEGAAEARSLPPNRRRRPSFPNRSSNTPRRTTSSTTRCRASAPCTSRSKSRLPPTRRRLSIPPSASRSTRARQPAPAACLRVRRPPRPPSCAMPSGARAGQSPRARALLGLAALALGATLALQAAYHLRDLIAALLADDTAAAAGDVRSARLQPRPAATHR